VDGPVKRSSRCLVVIALFMACPAAGQTTADGLEAVMRGDYETALGILRPLAEDAPAPDPLAQFFVSALYRYGVGVPVNLLRACGLSRAAQQSLPLLQALPLGRDDRDAAPAFADECRTAPGHAWRTPDPVAFTLEAGQQVTLDGSVLRVDFEGRNFWMRMGWGPDVWFLPVRHTALDVLKPVPGRRHFIEFFVWTPVRDTAVPTWTLTWTVHEVDGARLAPHSWQPVKTIAATLPPLSPDERALAQWVLNADGEVEQRVAESPSPERRE